MEYKFKQNKLGRQKISECIDSVKKNNNLKLTESYCTELKTCMHLGHVFAHWLHVYYQRIQGS